MLYILRKLPLLFLIIAIPAPGTDDSKETTHANELNQASPYKEELNRWQRERATLQKEYNEVGALRDKAYVSLEAAPNLDRLKEAYDRLQAETKKKWIQLNNAIRSINMYQGLLEIEDAKPFDIDKGSAPYADQSAGASICTAVAISALYAHQLDEKISRKEREVLAKQLRDEIVHKHRSMRAEGVQITKNLAGESLEGIIETLDPKWKIKTEKASLAQIIKRGKGAILSFDFSEDCTISQLGKGHAYALLGYDGTNLLVEDYYKGRHTIKAAEAFRCASTFTEPFRLESSPAGLIVNSGST
jgi:hypothetical protein